MHAPSAANRKRGGSDRAGSAMRRGGKGSLLFRSIRLARGQDSASRLLPDSLGNRNNRRRKMIANCVLLTALSAFTWTDVRKKELPLPLLAACAAAGLIICLVTKDPSLSGLLGGVCVGGVLLLCALVSRESIGSGDGLLFIVTGIYLGFWGNLVLLFMAAAACAAVGGILMLTKKYTRKQSLPFAPFVLASDVMMLVLAM